MTQLTTEEKTKQILVSMKMNLRSKEAQSKSLCKWRSSINRFPALKVA